MPTEPPSTASPCQTKQYLSPDYLRVCVCEIHIDFEDGSLFGKMPCFESLMTRQHGEFGPRWGQGLIYNIFVLGANIYMTFSWE